MSGPVKNHGKKPKGFLKEAKTNSCEITYPTSYMEINEKDSLPAGVCKQSEQLDVKTKTKSESSL